jgi:hypothetical protein
VLDVCRELGDKVKMVELPRRAFVPLLLGGNLPQGLYRATVFTAKRLLLGCIEERRVTPAS